MGNSSSASSLSVHPQLRPLVSEMSFFDAFLFRIIHFVDKLGIWHRLPVFIGVGYLGIRRHLHQKYNLKAVGETAGNKYDDVRAFPFRTADGTHDDPHGELVGSSGTFFGRNMSPSTSHYGLMDPHPSVVAAKLLARKEFVDTGKQFNMLACSWIQFMIHDWVDHIEDTQQDEIEAPKEVASLCPLKSFGFFRSRKFLTGSQDIKIGYLNRRTPWWDASVIDGNDETGMRRVRTFKDGKLKISGNGLLEHDEKGIAISGDVRNSWAGVSTLQVLFIKEHNSICDMLKERYPDLDDERLYRYARLVTSAVIAKIHTIDWTVKLLKTDTLLAAMRINWYGILGKKFKDTFGHVFGPLLSGLVGQKKPENHGVPYSLTEEFVGVYRMHSLLPDKLVVRDIKANVSGQGSIPIEEEVPMEEMVGRAGEQRMSTIGAEKMVISMGHQACGALTLYNYPVWMRKLVPQDVNGEDRSDLVDMAALEIYRDRERGVGRYNEFRRNMLMIPISRWEDLTDDTEAIRLLRGVYGDDVEKLDLLVGLMAEKKIKGFAISETAFFIFLLMASRRLEADRFFTTNFNAETYTKEGLEWVNTTESLKDVIERHYPDVTKKWLRSSSAFSVWDTPPARTSWIPLYLRPAT